MIEVEKKFQPTNEQLVKLLEAATSIKEKTMHDVYYDFPDFRIFKTGNRLRKRDNGFELKRYIPTKSGVAVAEEYIDEKLILEVLKLQQNSLEEIVKNEMQSVCDYITLRKEYRKNEFVIDVDEMDFGVGLIEIETLVENEDQIPNGEKKILDFAKSFGLEAVDLPLKTEMYLQKMRPEIYKEIFGMKEFKFKIK